MKFIAFLLLGVLAFAAQSKAASTTTTEMTLSQLVAKICPNISSALYGNFKILTGLIANAGTMKVNITTGDLVLVTPTDAAFTTLLGKLTAAGFSQTQLASNNTLVLSLIAEHIAIAPSNTSNVATTLSGSTMSFSVGGTAASLDGIVAAASKNTSTVSVSSGLAPVNIISAVTCPDQGQYALEASSVIVPKQFASLFGAPSPPPPPHSSASRRTILAAGTVACLLAAASGL